MIIVKGTIPVKSDRQTDAVELVQQLARVSREEKGCVAYEIYLQADCMENIVIFQQWDSIDALERHFASEHVDSFLDLIPDFIEGQVTSMHFDVISRDDVNLDVEAMDELEDAGEAGVQVQLDANITIH